MSGESSRFDPSRLQPESEPGSGIEAPEPGLAVSPSSAEPASEAGPRSNGGTDKPAGPGPTASAVQPSTTDCGCPACASASSRTLVYALGTVGYDLVSEARRDSIGQQMEGNTPNDPHQFLDYLDKKPWEATSVTWTLLLDQTPIYAIKPIGPFADYDYRKLQEFLRDQLDSIVERVAIPGRLVGQTSLIDGQVVPVIEPELRGMASWNTRALIQAIAGPEPSEDAPAEQQQTHRDKVRGIRNVLERIYFELRNLGFTAQDRALNYAATNALVLEPIYEETIREGLELDTIAVERSPVCRPGSDCWDVKLIFFNPRSPVQSVRRVSRFTVDVSDVVPVMVGPARSWFIR